MAVALSYHCGMFRIAYDDRIIAKLYLVPLDYEQPTDTFETARILDFINDTLRAYDLSYMMMNVDSALLLQAMYTSLGTFSVRPKILSYSTKDDHVVIWTNIDYKPGRQYCVLEMDVYKHHTIVEYSRRVVINPTVRSSGLKVFKISTEHGPFKDCAPFVYKVQVYERTTLVSETDAVIMC